MLADVDVGGGLIEEGVGSRGKEKRKDVTEVGTEVWPVLSLLPDWDSCGPTRGYGVREL